MNCEVSVTDGVTTARLSGDFGEQGAAELEGLAQRLGATPLVVLDLGNLQAMTSLAIASWCAFIEALERKAAVEFREVPPFLMYFAGMVRTFFGRHGRLASVQVPGYCDACSAPSATTCAVADLAGRDALPPLTCATCGGPTAPDLDPEELLATLNALTARTGKA